MIAEREPSYKGRGPSQSVAALRRELENEKIKSKRVDEMFEELFGELGIDPYKPLPLSNDSDNNNNNNNNNTPRMLTQPQPQRSRPASPTASIASLPHSHHSSAVNTTLPLPPSHTLSSIATEPLVPQGAGVGGGGGVAARKVSTASGFGLPGRTVLPVPAMSPPSPEEIEVIVEESHRSSQSSRGGGMPASPLCDPGGRSYEVSASVNVSEGSAFGASTAYDVGTPRSVSGGGGSDVSKRGSEGGKRGVSPGQITSGVTDAVLQHLLCLDAMGPLMRDVFSEIQGLAQNNENLLLSLPALKEYASRRAVEAEAWHQNMVATVVAQRFQSAFLGTSGGQGVLFEEEIVAKLANLTKHTVQAEGGVAHMNLRGVLVGPKDSGKSTLLHLFCTQVLFPQALRSGAWEHVFVVPINFDLFLAEAVLDLAVTYCKLVQHFVDLLIMQRPGLRKWALQISSFWKRVVTQSRPPTLPSDLLAVFDLNSEWALHASLLQRCFAGGYCEEFLEAVMGIPDLFTASLRFKRVFWVLDGMGTAGSCFTTDGRGGDVGVNLSLVPHIYSAMSRAEAFFVIAAEAVNDLDLIKGMSVIPVADMITHEDLNRHYPGLPLILRCSGREYSVRVFRGCPGYVVPFINLLEATAAIKDKARQNNPQVQRSVEFYGSAVEGLLERLSGLNWDDPAPRI